MAYSIGDWIRETTATTGTGTMTLSGAVSGYQTFAPLKNPSYTTYTIEDGVDVEHGIGQYVDLSGIGGPRTLSREEVLFSTNSGSKLNLSGSAEVYCTHSSYLDYLWRTPSPPCVRMSLDSTDPFPGTDQSAKTTLYIHRVGGDRTDIYNTTRTTWQPTVQTATLSLTTFSASTMYDIFVYDGGSHTLAAEKLAWTNVTTRATALVWNEGRLVKSGDASRLYIGSVYADGSSQLNDTASKRDVWNHYNRVPRHFLAQPTGGFHTYSSTTYREFGGGSTLGQTRVSIVCGEPTPVEAAAQCYCFHGTSGQYASTSVGVDTSSVSSAQGKGCWVDNSGTQVPCEYRGTLAAGYHTLRFLQQAVASGTMSWAGVFTTSGADVQAALTGSFLC